MKRLLLTFDIYSSKTVNRDRPLAGKPQSKYKTFSFSFAGEWKGKP